MFSTRTAVGDGFTAAAYRAALALPARTARPRKTGLTVLIDCGLPTGQFRDAIESYAEHIDLVKFGWGTALVSPQLDRKIAVLREHRIGFFFGGTLFERFVVSGAGEEYAALCHSAGCSHVEVSDGTLPLSSAAKAHWISRFAEEFHVLSEVGYKDPARAAAMTADQWISAAAHDLSAGASYIVTETRESGRSGLATPDGKYRQDVLGAILDAVGPEKLIFEAPTKDLQVELVRQLGANVNLANVNPLDVIALETLRLGLRSDTMPVEDPRQGNPSLRVVD